MMGGSGKRSLPMAHGLWGNTIGKLRGLRLPLPPALVALTAAGGQNPWPRAGRQEDDAM